MALRQLRYEGDEILRKKCKKVEEVDDHIRMILDDNVYYATVEECNIEKLERSDT